MKPPTSNKLVLDIYLAATAPDDIRPREGNKIYGNNAVTEIGKTSKIQKQAMLIRQYLNVWILTSSNFFNMEHNLCHRISVSIL